MHPLIEIIISTKSDLRNRSLEAYCEPASLRELETACATLETFRLQQSNLYEQVRALFFLYAIYRFHMPKKEGVAENGRLPFSGFEHLLNRRFEEAIQTFLAVKLEDGVNKTIASGLAAAYYRLGFQTLANQVRKSVRQVQGNQWMFRMGHPEDHPLRIRPELHQLDDHLFPILQEKTPVRMDLTHSGWSDIFFLGMDFPEGARVLNISIDLAVKSQENSSPTQPVEAYFRLIDAPEIRLTSVDLETTVVVDSLAALFDYAKDYLGLLKAAVIAAGLVPPGLEGSGQPLQLLLEKIIAPGKGFELVSKVNNIPKGSRLAVSTTLLASLITVCMRATGQTERLTGQLTENERRLVAARAILGEWLAGSGGGWQDSGGVWPGMKLIQGELAQNGDPEWQISRGRLLPSHQILELDTVSPQTRAALQQSLVLVHGGMAQDVGPILEMVTEKYLLRSTKEWHGRLEAMRLYDQIVRHLKEGDIQKLAQATHQNFHGPLQTIIPWAGNRYTNLLIQRVEAEFEEDFWGFWMLGGMAGGGMGFIFAPSRQAEAQNRLQSIMVETKRQLETAVPFAMDPVVYEFKINETGTSATLLTGDHALMPPDYYTLILPDLLRQPSRQISPFQRSELDKFGAACRTQPALGGMVQKLFDRLLPRSDSLDKAEANLSQLLAKNGFDPVQHAQIRADLRSGRIGLAQNRLPVNTQITDIQPQDLLDATHGLPADLFELGLTAIQNDQIAVVSLAGGAGSRWSKGAGVVKALNPFVELNGRHRSFIEIHLAKSQQTNQHFNGQMPHILTTSYLTHTPIAEVMARESNFGYQAPLILSRGRSVGLRLIPMARDLRFAWEETSQQLLDQQAQKVQDSLHKALINWALASGEGSDYTDNLPRQCLHPVGHWYEVPNMLLNGVLADLLQARPSLTTLMIHNIDTVGVHVDPALLGAHLVSQAGLTTEVIGRQIEDQGGGLARVNGRVQLIEGLALPHEAIEFDLSTYNSSTTWVEIDALLTQFGLTRMDLDNKPLVESAVRQIAARMPTYITLKEVKKRWGNGQEDIFPVTQFEKLWGDMTTLPGLKCSYILVDRQRGQQIKEVAQLDGWLRDGSAEYLASLCSWD